MVNYNDKPILKERLMSLDALRGLDMFFLVGLAGIFRALPKLSGNEALNWLANQCHHTVWQGFHMYDLIFPLFIFIVGTSMPFAMSKRLQQGNSRKKLYVHVIKRSLILFFLGLVLNGLHGSGFPDFKYTGVLQRIAIAYFFSALIVMNTNTKKQAIIAGSLLVVYWLLMTLVPVPGYGPGVITPEGNLHTFIDQWLLPGKLNNVFYDEDGILQQISSIAVCLSGVLAGHWLKSSNPQNKKVLGLLAAGSVSILVALLWNFSFPIIFKLWSSSFAMLAIGLSSLLLGLFYWIIDVKGYKKWAFFFVVVGLNPITIYVASSLVKFGDVANVFVGAFDFGDARSLVFATAVASIKWLFLYYLYRQKVFLKI